MRLRSVMFLILFVFIFSGVASAHHAMEYIETESYSTALRGEYIFHAHYDYFVENKQNPQSDHWEFTPGISRGLTNNLMLDVHTHFAKFGNDLILPTQRSSYSPTGPSPFLEAVAFTLQYRFPENSLINVAVIGNYEYPFERSQTLLDGQHVQEIGFIASKSFSGHQNICLNLKVGRDGNETVSMYALAAKTPLSADIHGIAGGVELLGSFQDFQNSWSVLPGIYMPLGTPNTIFKTGLEFGRNMDYMRVNATLMVRF